MQITLEEFLVRIRLFQDVINNRLKLGSGQENLILAYAGILALIHELEKTMVDLRENILPSLEGGVRQQALCLVNMEQIRREVKKAKRKKPATMRAKKPATKGKR